MQHAAMASMGRKMLQAHFGPNPMNQNSMERMPLEMKEMIRRYMTPEALRTMSETDRFWKWFTEERRKKDKEKEKEKMEKEEIIKKFFRALKQYDNDLERALSDVSDIDVELSDKEISDVSDIDVELSGEEINWVYTLRLHRIHQLIVKNYNSRSPNTRSKVWNYVKGLVKETPTYLTYLQIQRLMDLFLADSETKFPNFYLFEKDELYSIFRDQFLRDDGTLNFFIKLVNLSHYDPLSPFYGMEDELIKDTSLPKSRWEWRIQFPLNKNSE